MKGQVVGYVRVSSEDQNPDRQIHGIHEAGFTLDRSPFVDLASGKNRERPAFQDMLSYVRQGDKLVVYSIDRLARSLPDLEQTIDELTGKGVEVVFVKEGLRFNGGTDDPFSVLQRQLLAAFAQFERAMIRERQREGIDLAKKRGVYKGRKRALSPAQENALRERSMAGEKHADLMREFDVSKATFYRLIRVS